MRCSFSCICSSSDFFQYHPDKYDGPDVTDAHTKFSQVQRAWQLVGDDEKKKAMDLHLRRWFSIDRWIDRLIKISMKRDK